MDSSSPPSDSPSASGSPSTRSLEKLADDLMDLGDAAARFLESFERWDAGEDASPYAVDRLRERALMLKLRLKRLGLP